MKKYVRSVACVLILYTITIPSCKKENQPPVANAGDDKEITFPANSIILDGRGSKDPDNNITN